MNYIIELIAMIFSEILIIGLLFFTRKQKKGNLKRIFTVILSLMFIWTTSMIMQIIFQNSNIELYTFEKFASFGAVPMGVAVLFLGRIFSNSKFKFRWYHCLWLIIPIITITLTITNEYHNLFVVEYSTTYNSTKWGPYFPVHSLYSYATIFIGIIYLMRYTAKNSGFFSKQSIMILVGTLVPVGVNMLATYSN